MGAVVSSEVVAPYTWLTATFAWNSETAALKSWAEADILDWTLEADDPLALVEVLSKTTGLSRSSSIAFTELGARSFTKGLAQALALAETAVQEAAFQLSVSENIGLTEALVRETTKNLSQALVVSEVYSYLRSIDFSEDITVSDTLARAWLALRAFSQGVVVSDGASAAKAVTKGVTETVELVDQLLRRANAVMSDLLITAGDLTQAEFLESLRNSSAPAYEDFRAFMNGDYRYQDALFRQVLESTSSDRPRILTLKAKVDVPDVHDRGVAEIPAAATFVPFNRVFVEPPEVFFRFTDAADDARGRITSITNLGFTIEIRDGADILLVGDISWSAHGY